MQVAGNDVFAGGEVGKQVEFLINDADAQTLRVPRGGDFDGYAVKGNGAAVGARGSGQYARQRALAGAVLPMSACTSPSRSEKVAPFSAYTPP